jgi:peptide/nickel transport system substrate-binding protein
MSRPSVRDVPIRGSLLALISAVVLMLAPGADAAPEGRVVVAVASEPTTFDAHVFSDQPTYNVILNVFDTLVERGPDMQLRPLLAESYRLVDDRTWQFKLRKGIQFTNGEPFNAQVVKWNVERMLDPATKSKNIGRVSAIERVDVVDDLTVNIRTKAPYPILDAQLARVVHMMPPRYVQEKGATHIATNPIGTGPYRVVRWVKDDELVLEANERYWRGAPRIKTIVIKPIPETTARVYALLNGEVDLAGGIAPNLVPGIEASSKAQVRKVPSLEVMYCGLYGTVGPTANKKVRQAINYGVNVDAILKGVMEGDGERRAGILAREAFGFDPTVKPYPYDPERARQLLREANYPADYDFVVNVPVGRYLNDKTIGEAIAADLKKIGIKASVKPHEWGNYVSATTGQKLFPMQLQGWGPATLDADDLYSTNLHSKSPFSHFQDERLDRLVEEGRSTLDKDKRLRIYREIAQYHHEEATHLFLWQSVNIYGVSKRLTWTPRPDEYVKLYDAALK